jgi:glycosyltransferase 2 family protein
MVRSGPGWLALPGPVGLNRGVYMTGKSEDVGIGARPIAATSSGVWLLVKAALSLAVLGAVFSSLDLGKLRRALERADGVLLAISVAVLIASIAAAALRWALLSRPSAPMGVREAISVTFAAQFVGQVLPSSLGQDAVRAALSLRPERTISRVISTIVLDRACGLIGISALIMLSLPRLLALGGVARGRDAALLAGGLVCAALALTLLVRVMPAPNGFGPRAATVWLVAQEAARILFTKKGMLAIVASIALQAMVILSAWIVARAIGIELSVADSLATIPAAMLAAMLPISLNGWGVREGAMIFGLGLAGVAAPQAFLISVLFGVSLMAASLPGAAALFLRRRRQP